MGTGIDMGMGMDMDATDARRMLGDFLTLPPVPADPDAAVAAGVDGVEDGDKATTHGNVFVDAGMPVSVPADASTCGFDTTVTVGGRAHLSRLLRAPRRTREAIERIQAEIGRGDRVRAGVVRKFFSDADSPDAERAAHWVLGIADAEREAREASGVPAGAAFRSFRSAAMKQWPMNMLYFGLPGVSRLNDVNLALRANYAIQCFVTPASMLMMPVAVVVAPYMYLRVRLGIPMTARLYFRLLRNGIGRLMDQSDVSWMSVAVWLLFLAAGIVQVVQNARNLYLAHREVTRRVDLVRRAMAVVADTAYASGLSGLRQMILDPEPLRRALHAAYVMDAHECIRDHVSRGHLTPVTFGETSVFRGLAHPAMAPNPGTVRNPCDLSRGIVVTGPNASGKSTYARAALCATLMAQSIGFACARSATVRVYDTIQSHMRITDRLDTERGGDGESLFQAELGMCKNVVAATASGASIVFLDEPFHSVAPDVGDAIARAFLKRFRELGATVVVTSHYPGVSAMDARDGFAVVGFDCYDHDGHEGHDGPRFSYRLSRGRSGESVVLDMIRSETDETVLRYAREFLDGKICDEKMREVDA